MLRSRREKFLQQTCLLSQEAFNKKESGAAAAAAAAGAEGGGEVRKRIHVRSKDPSRIARQLEKNLNGKQPKNYKGVSAKFEPKHVCV